MTDDFMDRYTIHAKEPCSDKTILRDNLTEELVLMREITICTHQDYKDMVEALVIQQKLNHPHLLSLLGKYPTTQSTSLSWKAYLTVGQRERYSATLNTPDIHSISRSNLDKQKHRDSKSRSSGGYYSALSRLWLTCSRRI